MPYRIVLDLPGLWTEGMAEVLRQRLLASELLTPEVGNTARVERRVIGYHVVERGDEERYLWIEVEDE